MLTRPGTREKIRRLLRTSYTKKKKASCTSHAYALYVCLQVSDPKNECQRLFQLLGFDAACIPAALGAMNKDSQGGQLSKRTHR